MAKENGKSRERLVRVPIPYDDHLIEKSKGNPKNPHNYVATEINALIKRDFESARKKRAAGARR